MQTFLPYPDFRASAEVLDTKRLGKQRVEVIQIVRALTVPTYAWKAHPAVLMWEGYEEALGAYGTVVSRTWCERGFDDTCEGTIVTDLLSAGVGPIRTQAELAEAGELPPWLGSEDLHRSHQSALVRKEPDVYRRWFPDVPDDIPYLWPVRAESAVEAERRREEAVQRRLERLERRAQLEAEKLARKRSRAAKKAARTRQANRARAAKDERAAAAEAEARRAARAPTTAPPAERPAPGDDLGAALEP